MAGALADQTVVVVGGSAGIGAAVAGLAAAEGARVVAVSRSGSAGPGVTGYAADVCDGEALQQALGRVDRIDHLVYTAAPRLGSTPLPQLTHELLEDAFAAKLFGALHAVQAALPRLAPEASITLTSGQVSRKYGVGTFVKGALNAAVDAAALHLAKELAPRRVNVVSPGVIDTDTWGEQGSEARAAAIARLGAALPLGRVGSSDEIARAYLFAMTTGFLTGAVLDVHGGALL